MAHVYQDRKSRGLVWVDSANGHLPHHPVIAGYESNGLPVYIGRAVHDGDCIPGKFIQSMGTCYVALGSREHQYKHYQVLTNAKHKNLIWVWASNGYVPPNAIVGGQEKNGSPLFIGRTHHNGSVATGKIHQGMRLMYYGFSNREHSTPQYEVLVKA